MALPPISVNTSRNGGTTRPTETAAITRTAGIAATVCADGCCSIDTEESR
jgi:hypothetical protein